MTKRESQPKIEPVQEKNLEQVRSTELEKIKSEVISGYKVEKVFPRRENETTDNYKLRTMLLDDAKSAVDRIDLVRSRLEYGAGVNIDKLNFREKASLTNYYLSSSSRNRESLVNFAKKFGENGLKTFLACEYGFEAGDQIIDLGEKLPPEVAQKIFDKYSAIVKLCHKTISEIEQNFKKEATPEVANKINENLLFKAKELLQSFYLQAGQNITPEEMLKKLDNINTDIILFASTFKNLTNSGEKVDFKEATDTKMETKKPAELSPAEREEMMRIFLANREIGYTEELLQTISADFENALTPAKGSNKATATFTILKHNNAIISFLRLEPTGENRLYAASFNTRPEAKGFAIGNAMMKEVLNKAAEENTISAVAYSQKPDLIAFYKRQFGFREVGETEIAGEKFVKIEKDSLHNRKIAQQLEKLKAA